MNFELLTTAGSLRQALNAIRPAAGCKSGPPILANALFSKGWVAATNLDMRAEVLINASKFEGVGCLHLPTLQRLVGAMDSDTQVQIKGQSGGGYRLEFDKSVYDLPGLEPNDFPAARNEGQMGEVWNCSNISLSQHFKRVLPAASTEETRYYLNGVCFSQWGGPSKSGERRPCIAATDGHRLIVSEVPGGENFNGQIVPNETAKLIASLASPQSVTFYPDLQYVQFSWPGYNVGTLLIDGSFPDFERVIPAHDDRAVSFTLAAGEVRPALARLSAVCSDRSMGVKIRLDDKEVSLASKGHGLGAGKEVLRDAGVRNLGVPLEIGFNGGYLKDHLRTFDDSVPIQVQDPMSPAVAHGEGVSAVLMPLRV